MKCSDINIRDPFVLAENGIYYLYGTRAANFGQDVGGFDVYTSTDLETWSDPVACFDSVKWGLNRKVNWAPEVHNYQGKYYMFATFTREIGLRGTYILCADSPLGPFVPHSKGAVTPKEWECLDGTFYVSQDGKPYMVFCHEHTQIIDGTICYLELSSDLTCAVSEPITLFAASSPYWADVTPPDEHRVTDGPFLYRTSAGELLMIWSTFIQGKYAECLVKFNGGELGTDFVHLDPMITDDGGHGMIFKAGEKLMLAFHSPNTSGEEHPYFVELIDLGTELGSYHYETTNL